MTVAGGEKLLHFVQSSSKQKTKWKATMISAWKDISAMYIVKSTKYFWLFSPTQLFTQGQWWSIFLMQRLHTLQW